jgi:hypothetical protein
VYSITRDYYGSDLLLDIVVTCFPQPWNTRRGAKNEVCGVLESIEEHLKDQERDFLESASDLVALIIKHCTGAVDSTKVSGDDGPLDIFEYSITSLVLASPKVSVCTS